MASCVRYYQGIPEGCHKHSTDIMWNAALQKYFAVKKKID